MGTGTGDMIKRCRKAGLPEPEFTLIDGFVTTIRRNPERAFEAVTGKKRRRTGQGTGVVTGEVAEQVTEDVKRVILVLERERTRAQIQTALRLKGRANFEERYLKPAIEAGLVNRTIPDKPKSRLQKYRLTVKDQMLRDRLRKGKRTR